MWKLLDLHSTNAALAQTLTDLDDTFLTDEANALITMPLDDFAKLDEVLGARHKPGLEDAGGELTLLTVKASQWNLDKVFLVALVHRSRIENHGL